MRMDWMNAVSNLIDRYSGAGGGTASAPADVHEDFGQVAQSAPRDVVAGGLSQAFRSDQTPPFPQMLANLFGRSDPNQRAGLLNQLLGSLGPAAASLLPGLGGGRVTPQQASQVSPEQVQAAAAHAEGQNPSIVDQVSRFYAEHPEVVKAAGGLALTIALQHMLRRR
jgi:hypothetical protein